MLEQDYLDIVCNVRVATMLKILDTLDADTFTVLKKKELDKVNKILCKWRDRGAKLIMVELEDI